MMIFVFTLHTIAKAEIGMLTICS